MRWTAYVLGVFHWLRLHYADQVSSGATVYIESQVPLNKGVSSSAAVEVAVMKAAARCYGIDLAGIELAEACQWIENVIAESACGIMDQAASVLGDEGLRTAPDLPAVRASSLVKLPGNLRCWAIDSGVRHAVTGIEYEAARAAAFVGYRHDLPSGKSALHARQYRPHSALRRAALERLSVEYPPSVFRSGYEAHLPERISGKDIALAWKSSILIPSPQIRPEVSYRVRACTRYAVEENQRVELFVELARGAGSQVTAEVGRLMGDLMFQSHWSYTECGLGCEATDLLIELVREECGPGTLFGAKITGGGGGGTVAVLGSSRW